MVVVECLKGKKSHFLFALEFSFFFHLFNWIVGFRITLVRLFVEGGNSFLPLQVPQQGTGYLTEVIVLSSSKRINEYVLVWKDEL